MKKFCIFVNTIKDPDFSYTKKVEEYLTKRGAVVRVVDGDTPVWDEAECLIVLGGDGTMLKASKLVLKKQMPLFGINLGTLGYLAEVDREGYQMAMNHLLADDFFVERRMMLYGTIIHNGKTVYKDYALNEIVISREGKPRIIRFDSYVNGEFLTTYKADAIIAATPTGSTGYSLSAGGPIIAPTSDMIMLTPLAAHTLNARSILLPKTGTIDVEIGAGRVVNPEHARVDFDGASGYPVETGDRIRICKASKYTRIIKLRKISFLEVLRNKLSNN